MTTNGSALEPLLLMTPGPTRVPERVLRAAARPMIHHRTPEFSRELGAMLELVGPVFGTATTVLPVHTTGRGALEAAVCNLFSPGDEIAFCCNGRFGEMWAKFAESYGLVVHRVCTEWTRDVDPVKVDALLERHPRIGAVALAYSDTSTGVANDVEGVARVARARGALVMVDGVSAFGGMPFRFDEWGIDFAATASQKCLMSGPGLALVALSERAWAAAEKSTLPRNYWDFQEIRRTVTKSPPEPPGTPPVQIVLQVAEALRLIHEEGLDRVLDRHARMAAQARTGAASLGLSLQCAGLKGLSATLTALALPSGIAPKDVRAGLKARGILTAAAMGPFEATAFRIGHMGDIRPADVERTLTALAEVLGEIRAR